MSASVTFANGRSDGSAEVNVFYLDEIRRVDVVEHETFRDGHRVDICLEIEDVHGKRQITLESRPTQTPEGLPWLTTALLTALPALAWPAISRLMVADLTLVEADINITWISPRDNAHKNAYERHENTRLTRALLDRVFGVR